MFARILENFDNLICIVGIDYTNVIQSLIADSSSGINTYEKAKDYLDKLFQARFDVNHNLDSLTTFAFRQLRKIDNLIFKNILKSKDSTVQNKLIKIIEYLKTPRQIKKWATMVLMVFIHRLLAESYPSNIMCFLMLSAMCTKHPIILDDLANHTLPLLSDKNRGYEPYDSTKQKDFKDRLLESVRITSGENNPIFEETCIVDTTAYNFLKDEILNEKSVKASLLTLLVRGYESADQVMVYINFFGEGINDALNWLNNTSNISVTLILSDLQDTLLKRQNYPIAKANIELIKKLSQRLINIGTSYFFAKYSEILIVALSKSSMTEVIEKVHLNLLILYVNSIIDFSSKRDLVNSYLFGGQVLSEIGYSKEKLPVLLQQAILRIESDIDSVEKIDKIIQEKINLIVILGHFIEWCENKNLVGKSEFLSGTIVSYIKSNNISDENKLSLIADIFESCAVFTESPSNAYLDNQQNPLHRLFDGNVELIERLKANARAEIRYYNSFEKCVTLLNRVDLIE